MIVDNNTLSRPYLKLYRVFLNPFGDIVYTTEIQTVDDDTVLNKVITDTDSSYIIVTAVSSGSAEYKARHLIWKG